MHGNKVTVDAVARGSRTDAAGTEPQPRNRQADRYSRR